MFLWYAVASGCGFGCVMMCFACLLYVLALDVFACCTYVMLAIIWLLLPFRFDRGLSVWT